MLCISLHLGTYSVLPLGLEQGFICFACSIKIAIGMNMAMSSFHTRTLSLSRYAIWLWQYQHTAARLLPFSISLRELQVSRAGDVTLNTRGENGREFRGVSLHASPPFFSLQVSHVITDD